MGISSDQCKAPASREAPSPKEDLEKEQTRTPNTIRGVDFTRCPRRKIVKYEHFSERVSLNLGAHEKKVFAPTDGQNKLAP